MRDTINQILVDPEVAVQKYSALLDRESRTLVMPYLRAIGSLTVLAWFNDPKDVPRRRDAIAQDVSARRGA